MVAVVDKHTKSAPGQNNPRTKSAGPNPPIFAGTISPRTQSPYYVSAVHHLEPFKISDKANYYDMHNLSVFPH